MIRGICEGTLRKVYDFSDMTDEELRCKFFQKLQECIDLCNNTNEIVEWLKNEGLENEVNELLSVWVDDGTLDAIINRNVLVVLKEELIQKINDNANEINTLKNEVSNLKAEIEALKRSGV